jgi:hypothetical protein
MSAIAQNPHLRLVVGVCCCVTALFLYVPAEAAATAFHDFYRHFVHPWGNVLTTAAIFVFSIAACASVFPVLRRGSAVQRLVASIVVACPVLILTRFLVWAGCQWSAQ